MKEESKIIAIKAREILDSKARPMVEVDVFTSNGSMGRGSSPCGTSVGTHEAFVLRNGGKRFGGLGVQKAVKNVNEVIFPAIKGISVLEQRLIDNIMIQLDGTPNKSRLGANAIYSVSIAVARAAANFLHLPLYRYLGGEKANILPVPMFNMINGGVYADRNMEFQEFLFIPTGIKKYSEALRMGVEVFYEVGRIIKKRYGQKSLSLGHSGGYAVPVNEPGKILEILIVAGETAGYKGKFKVGLDCAATHFFDKKNGYYYFKNKKMGRDEIIQFLEELIKSYPIAIIEDPLDEDDFEGFAEMTKRFPILILGDDLFASNIERLKKGITIGAANGIILKPNMVGTLSEALDTAHYAIEHGYYVVPSGRAGGGEDPIPEIAVSLNAQIVKFGVPQTGERVAKHNCLLRIEEELGESYHFPAKEIFNPKPK